MAEDPTAPVVPRVLVFFDYACQFCYLDWPRFRRLRAEHEAQILLVPYELRPTMPAEGVDISQIGPGHSDKVKEYMRRMAREGDLELLFPDFVPNTHFALALGEYGRDVGPEAHEALHEAIFSAYNARGEDIGREEVLLRIADEHALDTDDVALAFVEGRYDDRLHQFYHLALSMGVSATPSALICNELFIGSRPYQVLQESVERCLVAEHNIAAHFHVASAEDSEGATQAEGEPPSLTR
jgi:predicted DsbA family dithiol-disulfide isomerase